MTLATPRLRLTQVHAHNADELWRVMQMPHLREFQDVPRFTRDEFVQRVAARPKVFDGRAAGRFEWLVILESGQEPIGWVSLRIGENGNGSAEIGYSLIVKARGHGYASEAVGAVIAVAFGTELTVVEACCVPANAPSRRLLEKAGFTQVRVQTNGAVVRSKPVDICIYRMTRAEWVAGSAGADQVAGAMDRQQSRS